MSKKQSELKKSVLSKVRSLEKSIGVKSSNSQFVTQPSTSVLTNSQKKQIVAEAKEVKNKIGKFLQKLKTKANSIKQQSEYYTSNKEKQEYVEESSLTNDPYQFRKNNPIILQKGLKKQQKPKQALLSSQYYNDKPKQKSDEFEDYPKLHPLVRELKSFDETITTNSSVKECHKQMNLNAFIISEELGAGKYGHVYIAKHKKSGMVFALKKVNKKQIEQNMIKQICHEIKIQMFINHPNVIKMYSYFHDKGSLYLLLELATSGHLYDFLQKKIFIEESTVRNIVKQICSGLGHLHRFNIIHRDVKLENILYQMGMVKICDFGWSIETEDLRETFCGTPLYIAPQILLQKGYDKKIDVWCVGILTFELLYGRVPFEIKQQKDFMKIVHDEVHFPSDPTTSKSARNFIIQCLMKDPDIRPTFQELLAHPFIQKCEQLKPNQLF